MRPRPPTLTSIPSLLSVFQNEWDALALESYNLRQQLGQTRQELATALYQHDAAVRVIARLTRERDEARDALSKVTISAGAQSNGDAMQVDSAELPEELAEKVDKTQEKYEVYTRGSQIMANLVLGYLRVDENALCRRDGLLPNKLSPSMLSQSLHCCILAALQWQWMQLEDMLLWAAQMVLPEYIRYQMII